MMVCLVVILYASIFVVFARLGSSLVHVAILSMWDSEGGGGSDWECK